MSTIAGQRMLVIGGSSGIGFAKPQPAATQGAQVTIASRSEQRLRAALTELPEGVRGVQLDLLDEPPVERFLSGGPAWDHVVVTAAKTPMGAVRERLLT